MVPRVTATMAPLGPRRGTFWVRMTGIVGERGADLVLVRIWWVRKRRDAPAVAVERGRNMVGGGCGAEEGGREVEDAQPEVREKVSFGGCE